MIRQSELTESAFFDTHRLNEEPNLLGQDHQLFRLPSIPVDLRLKENRERRNMLEYERMKEKERIVEKRRQKQQNVQKVLRERSEAKENAKLMFDPCIKTCGNRFGIDLDWKKAEDIEKKIQQSRNRAEQYKTSYQKKIHKEIQEKEKKAKKKIIEKDNKNLQRSLNYHLAQWNQYEKKIAKKYEGQKINEKRMYETYFKKENQIKKILKEHQEEQSSVLKYEETQIGEPKRLLGKGQKEQTKNSKIQVQNNPIFTPGELSTFGLQKSIKNPEKMLESFLKFIEDRVGLESPIQDGQLLEKFEKYLQKDIQL